MLTIGLTGGIGSGKSTAAKILAEFGAPIIDADKVAHTTYAPDGGAAYDAVIAAFGNEIVAPDRTIDRKKLGAIVFGNPERLNKLTSIVWPATFKSIRAQLSDDERARHASLVIDNDGSLDELREVLKRVWSDAVRRNG